MLRILPEWSPAELDRREALLAERRDGLGDLLCRVRHQPGGVRPDAVVVDGAEQLAHRLAEGLPLDVPEGDVDAADRVDRDPAAADEDDAAIHLVPEPLDVERVLADQQLAEAVGNRVRARSADERRDGLGRRVDLTDAGDPLVRVDEDHEIVLAAVGDPLVHGRLPQDDGLDIGDLQARLLGTTPGGLRQIVDHSEIVNNPLESPDGWSAVGAHAVTTQTRRWEPPSTLPRQPALAAAECGPQLRLDRPLEHANYRPTI